MSWLRSSREDRDGQVLLLVHVLGSWLGGVDFDGWLQNLYMIRKSKLRSHLSARIVGKHDLDLDSDNSYRHTKYYQKMERNYIP